MSEQDISGKHAGELVTLLSPAYAAFASLEREQIPSEARAALGMELAGVVERLVRHEIKPGDWFGRTVQEILGQQRFDRGQVFAAWSAAVAEAEPMVRAIELVSRHLAAWLGKQNPTTGAMLLEHLPKLTVAFRDLDQDDIDTFMLALGSLESDEEARFLVDAVLAYDEAEPAIIAGIARLAEHALTAGRREPVERLLTLLPIEAAYESRDATRLIPAMAKLSVRCHAAGSGSWMAAIDLVVTIAESNVSSAQVTASRLGKRLDSLDSAAVPDYLAGFATLVRTMGIGVIGFSLKDLPRCFERHGVRPTRRWVEQAAQVATAYGSTAGRWFLEQKTEAARQAFPGNR